MVRLRPFRGTASRQNGAKSFHNSKPLSAVTNFLAPLDLKKQTVSARIKRSKMNNLVHVNDDDAPSHKISHKAQASEPSASNSTEEPNPTSRPSVKKWMRKVKDFSTATRSDGKPSLFQRRPRIRKPTRTNENCCEKSTPVSNVCGKTVTDESSSKYSRGRNEESPPGALSFGNILRFIEADHIGMEDTITLERYSIREGSDHLVFDDDETVVENVQESPIRFCGRNVEKMPETSRLHPRHEFLLAKDSKDGNSEEEEIAQEHEPEEFPLPRSEILSKLFPFGHPNARKMENFGKSLGYKIKEQVKFGNRSVSNTEKENDRDETYRSPFHRSEVIRSLFPMGHPDDRKKKEAKCKPGIVEKFAEETEIVHEPFHDDCDSVELKEPESSGSDECDKFIGLVITFDPTWDLLDPENSDPYTVMTRSKLKKFHEIEDYTNSLLGKFSSEECSEESTDLLGNVDVNVDAELLPLPASPASSRITTTVYDEESSYCSFELGFHFDGDRFPTDESSPEIEICFYPDDEEEYAEELEISEKLREAWEFWLYSKDTNKVPCVDESDSKDNYSYKSLEDFVDCFEYEASMHRPLRSVKATPGTSDFSCLSSGQKLSNGNDFSPIINTKLTEIGSNKNQNAVMGTPPPLASFLSTSSTSSYNTTDDVSDAYCDGNKAWKYKFYDAIMSKTPNQLSNRDRILTINATS